MAIFSKESLEQLRQRINLVEVLSGYIQFSRSGSSYKSICPFHDEKTPSFIIHAGDTHYHCYGCGAHGDAISFLMNYQKLTFSESVEYLSEKFGVYLQYVEEQESVGPSKKRLKEVLDLAASFFHGYLLHTEEGHNALLYLYERGIDLDFIKTFQLGFSPKNPYLLQKALYEKRISKQLLEETGLISSYGKDFFTNRIMIPIRDPVGSVIGFTARKYTEDAFGPKYINTQETALFKKSKMLFGLYYCRKRIAKEKKVIIVEGQFDALRLINSGINLCVAAQGTAFGESHVKELMNLGINHVYLALDSDSAGNEAAIKIGDFFQKEAVDVSVIQLPEGMDPDDILKEKGPLEWNNLMSSSKDYLTFMVEFFSKSCDVKTPAGKNQLIQLLVKRIGRWNHPLMIHESLRKIAQLTQTPESMLKSDSMESSLQIEKTSHIVNNKIDPDKILEQDLLRWIFLIGETNPILRKIAKINLKPEHFKIDQARYLFEKFVLSDEIKDILSLAIELEDPSQQEFLSEMLQKKVNRDKAEEYFIKTLQSILDRQWMEKKEEIKNFIQTNKNSEEELFNLAKEFDNLQKNRPTVLLS